MNKNTTHIADLNSAVAAFKDALAQHEGRPVQGSHAGYTAYEQRISSCPVKGAKARAILRKQGISKEALVG